MSRVPWLVALALAVVAGWSVQHTIRTRSELDTVRAHYEAPGDAVPTAQAGAGPAHLGPTGKTADGEELAAMTLLLAARVKELEDERSSLRARVGEIQAERKKLQRLLERSQNAKGREEKARKSWQSRILKVKQCATATLEAFAKYEAWAETEIARQDKLILRLANDYDIPKRRITPGRPRPGYSRHVRSLDDWERVK